MTATARAVLAIALPAMLTSVATALFGIADIWVIGQAGDAALLGGVEIGAKLMLGLLVVFNFLRQGTVGLTAQAAGRDDARGQAETLLRALALAAAIGALLLLLKPWIVPAGLSALAASGAVAEAARAYVEIRYWGGPLWLVGIALTGWLIGRRRMRAVLVIEVAANLLHIALDLWFVLGLGWGVEGVAIATLLSEGAKLAMTAAVALREPPLRAAGGVLRDAATWRPGALVALLAINRDLFLRTLLLMTVLLSVTRFSAADAVAVLAANAILLQLVALQALILDGFESAAQVLGGEAAGARDRARFDAARRTCIALGLATAVALAGLTALAGGAVAASFSGDPGVRAVLDAHLVWLVAMPLAGVVSYVFDGLFIGATWTRAMLVTMAAAAAIYAVAVWALAPLGNHGLWAALVLFALSRGAGQALLLPRLARRTFQS